MGIYDLMGKDWQAYCLMSAVTLIEEMTKPHMQIQIKKYKDKRYHCVCFSSLELRMKDREFVEKLFRITKKWQKNKNKRFVGPSFRTIRRDVSADRYMFIFAPTWLSYIISECGRIPNEYTFKKSVMRIENIRQSRNEKKDINPQINLFKKMLLNKKLAAGAFIVSMDLEFRGIQSGRPSLAMSDKFKDFLEFMLAVAQKWRWTENEALSPVKMDYSLRRGINASPQFEFRLSIQGLKEIYALAGPLAIKGKDNCIRFHINRSNNYINKGRNLRKNNTKQKILNALKTGKNMTSTQLQFTANVGVDVVLDHLHHLEAEGKVIKQRNGKRYIWNTYGQY